MNKNRKKGIHLIFLICMLLFFQQIGVNTLCISAERQQNYHPNSVFSNYLFYEQKDAEIKNHSTNCISNNDVQKWAVIIAASGGVTYGINELLDKNDVHKLLKVLTRNGWDDDHILLLLEEKATSEAILIDSFNWLESRGEDEDDIILFYFCGHGYYHTTDEPPIDEPDGRDEIIHPWDPDFGGWNPDLFIIDDTFAEKFNTLKSKNIVIFMATCHAGGMIDGTSDLCKSGRVVLTACDVNEASYGMRIPFHWIFPYFCIQGLKGNADFNDDNFVSAEELLPYVFEPVEKRAFILSFFHSGIPIGSSAQHPQMYDGWPTDENNAGELVLINCRSVHKDV